MNLNIINQFATSIASKCGLTEAVEASNLKAKVEELAHGVSQLEQYLSYRYFDEQQQLFFGDSNIIGFMLEISPLVGLNDGLIKNLQHFFNDELPENSYLQFLLVASHEVEGMLNLWLQGKSNDHALIEKMTAKRAEFIRQRAVSFGKSDGRLARDFRIFVSFSKIANTSETSSILNFRSQLTHKFQTLELSYKICGANDLIWVTRSMLQMQICPQNYKPYDEHNILAKQILLPTHWQEITEQEIKHLSTDLITRCYHMVELPSEFWLSQNVNLLGEASGNRGISSRFIISYSLASNISKAGSRAILARGKKVIDSAEKWYSRDNRNLKREAAEWQDINDKASNGQQFLTEHWQIMITAPSKDIDRAEQELISLYNINHCGLSITKNLQLPALLSMLPLQQPVMWNIITRFKLTRLILSREALARLPIYAEWKGVEKPGVLLHGRRGQLFNFNPFVKIKSGNFNVLVIAPPGSGKSVFLQEMAKCLGRQNTRMFILDIGQSFANIANLHDGEIIQFGKNSLFNLNPFASFHENINPDDRDDLIKCSKALLELMCGVGDNPLGCAELEKAIVGGLVDSSYKLDISSFAKYLENSSSQLLQRYGATLYSYTNEGIYGKYFTGSRVASFRKLITVFEFEEIKNDEKLLSIVLQILLMEVTNQFLVGDRQTPFMIIVDEAWMLLDYAASFFDAFSRTVRKYGGSLVICVQNFSNMQKTVYHKTILENSAWTVLFKQDDKGIGAFKESEAFKDLIPLIKSISLEPGKYAEMLLHSTGVTVVGRLILDEYSNALYSTDASDFSFLRSKTNQGTALDAAVEELVVEKRKR